MGWKTSVIVADGGTSGHIDEEILNAFDLESFTYEKQNILQECLYAEDKQISIGRYKDNIIVCAPERILRPYLSRQTPEEDNFLKLFTEREVVVATCHSAVNYHAYARFFNGKRTRFKSIAHDEPKQESGIVLDEERTLYDRAKAQQNGVFTWEDDSSEDEMMEDFTFGVLKRRLGVNLMHSEGDELMEDIPFKTYTVEFKRKPVPQKKKRTWIGYVLFFILFIIWQILKRMYSLGE